MNAQNDPGSWPALLHRMTSTWAALLRLLFAIVVIAAVVALAWWLLDLGSIQFGPIVVEGTPNPAAASREAGG
ncbi:hypothetical protein [Lentzea sp. NBRC 102530]|uniref:hypothetical protein n=1 Tax=Lentzea sp. NBRC 102530 TaxID=3032201 RepID=UPI0024A4219A|nr:hypothetical protein [Lentzea sp. NBRC 102530]GLY53387.1 hypothetical protein Lesp01_70430 [Lentzea sp. NBRC 102530]